MQQKLGRCMLRLQQYERLLKAMVAGLGVREMNVYRNLAHCA